jgi:translocation and assembly module TamA
LISRESTPIWQKRWTYAYGAEILATNESRIGKADLSLGDAFFIGGLFGQLGYDRSNSLLDPTSGFRLTGRVNPEASLGNGTDFYLRNQIDGTVYYGGRRQLRPRRSDAGRVALRHSARRAGAVAALLCRRRRLGPGLRLSGARPRDAANVPLGGRSLAEFAVEGRYRFGNYGAVAFVDCRPGL